MVNPKEYPTRVAGAFFHREKVTVTLADGTEIQARITGYFVIKNEDSEIPYLVQLTVESIEGAVQP